MDKTIWHLLVVAFELPVRDYTIFGTRVHVSMLGLCLGSPVELFVVVGEWVRRVRAFTSTSLRGSNDCNCREFYDAHFDLFVK